MGTRKAPMPCPSPLAYHMGGSGRCQGGAEGEDGRGGPANAGEEGSRDVRQELQRRGRAMSRFTTCPHHPTNRTGGAFPLYFRNCENVGGTPQEDEPSEHQTRCRSPHSNGAPLKIPMAAQHHLRIDLDAIRGRHHTPSTLFGRWTRMASRTRRAVATACSASARG